MLKILFIGDIVGYIGREATKKILPKLKRQHKPDLIIANVENLAHGKGVTENTLKEMTETGIDYFTSGNHVFAKKEAEKILADDKFNILRPINYPPSVPGIGEKVINIGKKNILLLNLMGRVFMQETLDCPFRKFDDIIKKKENIGGIIVDFHAEATSEKKAFAYYADGKVSAVLGTHTHVQTADEQISQKGTAFITDIGMVGAKESILGAKKEEPLKTFLTQINYPHELPRQGECIFNAVLVMINTRKKIATSIKRIREVVEIK